MICSGFDMIASCGSIDDCVASLFFECGRNSCALSLNWNLNNALIERSCQFYGLAVVDQVVVFCLVGYSSYLFGDGFSRGSFFDAPGVYAPIVACAGHSCQSYHKGDQVSPWDI